MRIQCGLAAANLYVCASLLTQYIICCLLHCSAWRRGGRRAGLALR